MAETIAMLKTLDGAKATISLRDIKKGEAILRLTGKQVYHREKYSIQIAPNTHLLPFEGQNPTWKFLNHSCSPNAYINVKEVQLYALKSIEKGEEITVDYTFTENSLTSPFMCYCGSSNCKGYIS